ncbi:MAG TPA: DUF664 domain-containing protein [Kribbella sp.]|nr:DUF664 domain-containing protein [Kribbella sp.]
MPEIARIRPPEDADERGTLTGLERFWFAIDFAGRDVEWPWTDEDPHGCFPLAPDDTVAGLLEAYRTECARSRESTDGEVGE